MIVNGIPSKCNGNCDFTWDDSTVFSVSDVSPSSAAAASSLTIEGEGFGTSADDIKVVIGGVECEVTNCIDTEIVCTVGEGKWKDVNLFRFQ